MYIKKKKKKKKKKARKGLKSIWEIKFEFSKNLKI